MSRRADILDAALAEFTAHGVVDGSIAGIRRRSGASVGSIYHHFAGKEDIATSLYVEGLRDCHTALRARSRRPPRPAPASRAPCSTISGGSWSIVRWHGSCCSTATRG